MEAAAVLTTAGTLEAGATFPAGVVPMTTEFFRPGEERSSGVAAIITKSFVLIDALGVNACVGVILVVFAFLLG